MNLTSVSTTPTIVFEPAFVVYTVTLLGLMLIGVVVNLIVILTYKLGDKNVIYNRNSLSVNNTNKINSLKVGGLNQIELEIAAAVATKRRFSFANSAKQVRVDFSIFGNFS